MNISVNKEKELTYQEFKSLVSKHFLSIPEKIRENRIKSKYLEIYPKGKINNGTTGSSKQSKKDRRSENDGESGSKEQS